MVSGLFKNNTVEKILFFLFIHNRCYAMQLMEYLPVSLTPIQRSLAHLEKEQILLSYLEGKTRIYTWNPAYPLQKELEKLLQKAYTLLPAKEKKLYCLFSSTKSLEEPIDSHFYRRKILQRFWKKLETIQHLSLIAKSKISTTNEQTGEAMVINTRKESTLTFEEKGQWKKTEVSFTNGFRWTLEEDPLVLGLEHLRYGLEKPVFLFHLIPIRKNLLVSINTHVCFDDHYMGKAYLENGYLFLKLRIIGPKKNEELFYRYF